MLHSDCPQKFKILVRNAVIIRSKLLYGLDTAMLTPGTPNKLNNTFQLKGLRTILHMETTYKEIANTNEEVFRRANAAIIKRNMSIRLQTFEQSYKTSRARNCLVILAKTPSDPMRYTTLDRHGTIWDFHTKRHGRPKDKYVAFGIQDIWARTTDTYPDTPNA